ncbi:MAG: hypothetical protein H7Y37_11990 [Anaerolineae bacterium]|nr:hypothetical protein [Gloeobacterales cyanobacterium ES-bin-313]
MITTPSPTCFLPHLVIIDERPTLLMNSWEAVLALFGISVNELDLLTRLQVLAIRCALGLLGHQDAHAACALLSENYPDPPSMQQWLDLYIDNYSAKPESLAAAHALLLEATCA